MESSTWGVVQALAIGSAAASVVSFVAYGIDKAAARRGGRRVPERVLHMLALAGGWPGALAGQRAFRHKTVKRSFRVVFWTTIALNCIGVAAFVWVGRSGW